MSDHLLTDGRILMAEILVTVARIEDSLSDIRKIEHLCRQPFEAGAEPAVWFFRAWSLRPRVVISRPE